MRRFTQLYDELDSTTATSGKVAAIAAYFGEVPSADAAVALYFLCGERVKRAIPSALLRDLAIEATGYPPWLVGACYEQVGDLSETVALLLPEAESPGEPIPLHEIYGRSIEPFGGASDAERADSIRQAWARLHARERLVFHKLIRGGFRVGVQKKLVVRALAEATGLDAAILAQRLTGRLEPTPEFYASVVAPAGHAADAVRPLPFYLAHQLDGSPADTLGEATDWIAEWKYDGIRAQLVRDREPLLWSRGEEIVSEQFPEIVAAARGLPEGLILDGEVLGFDGDQPAPFAYLQTRLNRLPRSASQMGLFDRRRIAFVAFDVLRAGEGDLRDTPFEVRRNRLDVVLPHGDEALRRSAPIAFESWNELAELRQQSRQRGVEGVMLKHRRGVYGLGRTKPGDGTGWWKWKVDPYSLDAVLVMAQIGSGRRAGLFTDYTFALWDRADGVRQLVPFAKAYSGLTQQEIERVDAFVRGNTIKRMGPVREVRPTLVFELGFEGVQISQRHRSGLAVRFPRMLRWRHDKKPDEADTLDALRAMLPPGDRPS
ncbi:MAG: ATP-dependent DNA ligase [Planctomycetota bacterium]